MKADLKQPAWPGSKHTLQDFAWGIQDIQGRPYISIDCRLWMARIDHGEQGKKLEITSSELRPDIDRQGGKPMLVLQVTLDSELYGRAVGTATADISDKARAVDATNPVENAETSALGRALGMYGYGLIGSIASAEEVADALKRDRKAQSTAEGQKSSPRPSQEPQGASDGEWKEWPNSRFPAKCCECGQEIPLDMPRLRNSVLKKSKHITCPEKPVFDGADDFGSNVFGSDDDPLAAEV